MRAALLLFVVAGCTHHRDIKDAYELDDEVEVSGQYGQSVTAVATRTPGGGVTFVDKASGGVVPYEEIYRIEDTSHALGALEGLGIGGGIGVLTGGLLGYLDGDDDCTTDGHEDCLLAFSAGDKALIFGVVLGVLGGATGLVVGGLKGSTTVYERPGTPVTVRAGGPSGSVAGVTIDF